eukprot:12545233-Prorocentrum_lima.AAC.1
MLQWDGWTDPIDLLATTNILLLNKMEQRLIEMTYFLRVMHDDLSPQDLWIIAPPIAGVSAMARRIRGCHL